jgi:hypothetical protein
VISLSISVGCKSDIPTSYPEIELPPTNGQSTSIVIDDIIEVPPSNIWHKTINIPPTLTEVKLVGWCIASGGARNDIKVLVLNDIDFHNWRNFNEVEGLYQSEKTTVAEIDVGFETKGKYHLVFSNWFSEFSSKKVIAKVYLYWSIKPHTLTIGDTLTISMDNEAAESGDIINISANAKVTVEFEDEDCSNNLQIYADTTQKTAITVDINDPKVSFIAPYDDGTYVLDCGGSGKEIKGKFNIIPPGPSIGHGLVVDASSSNEPPRLNPIGNRSVEEERELIFTIKAIDPDDDQVSYYACNLPPGAEFDNNTGKFTWEPPRGSTGKKYFVHFEASDGVLNDVENIVIEVKH